MGPRIVAITVVRNRAEGLRSTLRSIREQTYPRLDVVVVDGGSADGTVEVLRANADWLTAWVSEPDAGIADAMNKGLKLARGDFVIFLHADDRFQGPTALADAVAQGIDTDHIWAFDILFGSKGRYRRVSPRPFNPWANVKNPLLHPGVLCPRRLFDELGGFDPRLLIAMDFDLWLRAYRAGWSLRRVPRVLAIMDDTGVSSRCDWDVLSARLAEERQVQSRHAQGLAWRLFFAVYWPAYLAYRRVRSALG